MRSSRLHSAHLLTALLSLICAALFLGPPTAAHAQNGAITGTVSGYVGSQTVQVSAQAPGSTSVYTANATPRYTISVPPGLYNVAVTNPSSGWYINPTRYSVTVNRGGTSGDYNFTMMPMGSIYSVSGYVYISPNTCMGTESGGGTPVTVNISGHGYSSSANITVPAGATRASYQFLNLPVFGYYTVSIAPSSSVAATSIQALTTTTLEFDSNLIAQRTSFNICGTVLQANGQPASGTVYIFYGPGLGVQSATVQGNGTYTFQNVPPNIWGVFMVDNTQWNYTPSWPQFQYAYVTTNDVTNINFKAAALVSDVTGNFSGLPNGSFGSVYLYQLVNGAWSAQPIADASTQGTIPWVIHNVAPGTYFVKPGPPPATGSITPLFLGAFTVSPGASSVFVGTFNYTVTGSGQLKGFAWTSPKMTWFQTADTSPVLTITGQFYGDSAPDYFGSGTMYLYPQGKPMNISMNLHPGSYTWTLTGQGPLRVSQTSGSFTIQAKQTTNIGNFIFTLPGPIVRFDANACGSAVCSSSSPDVATTNNIKLLENRPLRVTHTSAATPQDTTACTTDPTTPTTDVAVKAGKWAAAAATTTINDCSTGVDIATVPTIDFNGGFGPPDPNNPGYNQPDSTVPASNTTVQFTGVIYAAVDGAYQFQTTTNGPVALTVDNNPLINSWIDIQQTQTGQIYLAGGHQYAFTMSYAYDSASTAQVNLSWQQPTDSAINTIDTSFFDQASTLVPLNDLVLQQFGQIVDNYTTGDTTDQQTAIAAGYIPARTEGCVYSDQQNGTIPLYVYTNGTDNFSTATPAGQSLAAAGNYVNNGLAGYIFPTPLTDGSSIPLQTWNGNNDNFAAASQAGLDAAQQAGYVFLQTEGYVLPANACQ